MRHGLIALMVLFSILGCKVRQTESEALDSTSSADNQGREFANVDLCFGKFEAGAKWIETTANHNAEPFLLMELPPKGKRCFATIVAPKNYVQPLEQQNLEERVTHLALSNRPGVMRTKLILRLLETFPDENVRMRFAKRGKAKPGELADGTDMMTFLDGKTAYEAIAARIGISEVFRLEMQKKNPQATSLYYNNADQGTVVTINVASDGTLMAERKRRVPLVYTFRAGQEEDQFLMLDAMMDSFARGKNLEFVDAYKKLKFVPNEQVEDAIYHAMIASELQALTNFERSLDYESKQRRKEYSKNLPSYMWGKYNLPLTVMDKLEPMLRDTLTTTINLLKYQIDYDPNISE